MGFHPKRGQAAGQTWDQLRAGTTHEGRTTDECSGRAQYSEPARCSYFQVNGPPNNLELAAVAPKSYTPAHLSCLPGLSSEYRSFGGTTQALMP